MHLIFRGVFLQGIQDFLLIKKYLTWRLVDRDRTGTETRRRHKLQGNNDNNHNDGVEMSTSIVARNAKPRRLDWKEGTV